MREVPHHHSNPATVNQHPHTAKPLAATLQHSLATARHQAVTLSPSIISSSSMGTPNSSSMGVGTPLLLGHHLGTPCSSRGTLSSSKGTLSSSSSTSSRSHLRRGSLTSYSVEQQ